MANALLDGNVNDQNGVPVPGALVYVYDGRGEAGGLSQLYDSTGAAVTNPVTADDSGYWSAYSVTDRFYTLAYYWGGRKRYVEANVLLGTLGINTDPNVRADLASTTSGKGASLVSFESGKTVQDLASTAAGKGASLVGFKQSGTGTVATDLDEVAERIFHAKDLGAVCDGVTDDGAILTAAIASRFGTIATSQATTPVTIYFGDSRNVYNLATPITVQQNHVRLVGDGAVLNCSGANAVIGDHDASANILFGVKVRGFTLKGAISADAIKIKSGSQCSVDDIRNYAAITGAIVHLTGTIASQTNNINSDAYPIGSCAHVLHESVYEKTAGNFFNCIANHHRHLLGYHCTSSGALLEESDAFLIVGDFETCDGPGVDLLNCRFGTVSTYNETNGQTATNTGTDTPDDIRIRSDAGGSIITQSSNIRVVESACAGTQVGGVTPNNVHIIDGDECLVEGNSFGGNIAVEAGCLRNTILEQARFLGTLTNLGSDTIDGTTRGKTLYAVGTNERFTIDAFASGGAKVGSAVSLLRLYGVTSLTTGTTVGSNLYGVIDIADANTTGTYTFGSAEPDANYIVLTGMWDVSGGSATKSVMVTARGTTAISVALDAAPGAGKTVRIWLFVVRIN